MRLSQKGKCVSTQWSKSCTTSMLGQGSNHLSYGFGFECDRYTFGKIYFKSIKIIFPLLFIFLATLLTFDMFGRLKVGVSGKVSVCSAYLWLKINKIHGLNDKKVIVSNYLG